MAGAFGELTLTETELERTLERFALCQLESLPTSRYLLPPRLLLDIGAKQLAGYGGSLDTAATDITHYLTAGSGVLVLCGGAVALPEHAGVFAAAAHPGGAGAGRKRCPAGGTGADRRGRPVRRQRMAGAEVGGADGGAADPRPVPARPKRPRPPKSDSRQRLLSYADLEVGDLVVHVHHGIGRFVGMLRLPVDGVEKDYIKIQLRRERLPVRARHVSWIW